MLQSQFRSLLIEALSQWELTSLEVSPNFNERSLQVTGVCNRTRKVLRLAADCLEPGEVYCDISTQPNPELIEILVSHPTLMALSVLPPEPDGYAWGGTDAVDTFIADLLQSGLAEQVLLCQQPIEDFFHDLRHLETEEKIGLLFCDAAHDYRSQFLTLLLAKPFLADQSIILVNEGHWSSTQQAIQDFSQLYPQCQLWFDGTNDLPVWNGLQIFLWNTEGNSTREHAHSICAPALIEALTAVQAQEEAQQIQFGLQQMDEALQTQQIETAVQAGELLLRWQPQNLTVGLKLVEVYLQQGSVEKALAIAAQIQAIANDQENTLILRELGYLLSKKGYVKEAEAPLQAVVLLRPTDDQAYCDLGFLYLTVHIYDKAAEYYQQALALNPQHEEACYRYVSALIDSGDLDRALQAEENILNTFPDSLRLKCKFYLALPVLYSHPDEIFVARQRFTTGLQRLIQETTAFIQADLAAATLSQVVYGLGFTTNFFLAYQNCCDRTLQEQYGQFVHQVLAQHYPDWVLPRPVLSLSPGQKIRIGYVSRFLHRHTISKLFRTWITGVNRDQFEIFVYYLDGRKDEFTEEFRATSDRFVNLTAGFEQSAAQILADQLQVLVYLDIGMNPETTLLAGLRLAPVQCMTWGHPVTSGLPTMDYFLSSALMEPPDAQAHYTEKLVCLPNLSISYPVPDVPIVQQPRSDILPILTERDVVYLSCQSLFKYLPQYDFVFPAIAQQIPHAKFIFLSHFSQRTTEAFQQRLRTVFAAVQLQYEDYCLLLPRQHPDAYLALNQIADVYLDTFAWSGGNTTLEAVACGLPIVTCPGQFMRGRHSSAILQRLDIPETIAQDEQAYIEIAVRLGQDRDWRQEIIQKMSQNRDRLYNDPVCLQALETFYQSAVQEQLSSCTPKIK